MLGNAVEAWAKEPVRHEREREAKESSEEREVKRGVKREVKRAGSKGGSGMDSEREGYEQANNYAINNMRALTRWRHRQAEGTWRRP